MKRVWKHFTAASDFGTGRYGPHFYGRNYGSLQAQGITVTQNPEIKRALFLSGYEALDEIEEFENGLLYVQDTASMLAVELAAPKTGDTVIDVCAAPGGKSVYAARMMR